jgi:hypothetical protein
LSIFPYQNQAVLTIKPIMMNISKTIFPLSALTILMLLTCCNGEQVMSDVELKSFSETVKAEDIKQHIAVLADDSLKGRLPGTTEYDKAMAYVVEKYKALGLKPKGNQEGTSFYQELSIRTTLVNENESYLIMNNSDTLTAGQDYFFLGNADQEIAELKGELVFAGYGIEAPEYGFDDFKDIEVKNKVVLVILGTPDIFPASERAYFGNLATKIQTLDKKGASAIFFMLSPEVKAGIERIHSRFSKNGFSTVIMPSGKASGMMALGDNLKIGGFMNWASVEGLFDNADEAWANYRDQKNGPMHISKTTELSGKVSSSFKEIESANVIGVLEGGSLKNEYLIHTAHLDHIGIGNPVEGDSIYNGAHDNASGVSAMLEIARLYNQLPGKPKRSVLFAAVTGEEMGLLGSAYLAANPTVEQGSIIANVNTDMPTLIAPIMSVEPLGAEQSSIMGVVERSTRQLGLTIDADHAPEQVRFVRSDNYNFILAGIPALRMKYGLKTEDSETGLDSLITAFTKAVYHKPSDELNDTFNFEAGRTYVRLQFMNSYMINNAAEKPVWNEKSFFKRFKKEANKP